MTYDTSLSDTSLSLIPFEHDNVLAAVVRLPAYLFTLNREPPPTIHRTFPCALFSGDHVLLGDLQRAHQGSPRARERHS